MRLKRSTEDVAEYFRLQGCTLLDEYQGCMKPMKYRCSCGRDACTSWNNFTNGKRCGYCHATGRKKRYTQEEAAAAFSQWGCTLLDEYHNLKTPMRYRCKCGRIAKKSLAVMIHDECRGCKVCGIEKQSGPGHWAWQEDRAALRLKQLFRKKVYKALASTLKATGRTKVGRTSDMIGYGPKELQEHVESHPNWPLVKDGEWDLDHIWPIQAFLDHGIKNLALINCLDNLRPLARRDNQSKHDRYDRAAFQAWLGSKQKQWSHKIPEGSRVSIACGDFKGEGTVLKRVIGLAYEVAVDGDDGPNCFSEVFLSPA